MLKKRCTSCALKYYDAELKDQKVRRVVLENNEKGQPELMTKWKKKEVQKKHKEIYETLQASEYGKK